MKTLLMIVFHTLGIILWGVIIIGYLAMILSPFWLAKAALVAAGISALSLVLSVVVKRFV